LRAISFRRSWTRNYRFRITEERGSVEQELAAMRRAWDLVAAFLAQDGDLDLAELERLLNKWQRSRRSQEIKIDAE